MKAHYKTADGRLVFEVNGETPKQLFEQVSAVQEIFEAEQECAVCHNDERRIRFRFRVVGNFRYYSLQCLHCFAEFHFGQAQQGGALFPKRRDQDGKPLPHRGWAKYERKPKPGEQSAAAPAAKPSTGPQAVAKPNGAQSAPRAASAPAQPQGEYQDPYGSAGITDDDVPF